MLLATEYVVFKITMQKVVLSVIQLLLNVDVDVGC